MSSLAPVSSTPTAFQTVSQGLGAGLTLIKNGFFAAGSTIVKTGNSALRVLKNLGSSFVGGVSSGFAAITGLVAAHPFITAGIVGVGLVALAIVACQRTGSDGNTNPIVQQQDSIETVD